MDKKLTEWFAESWDNDYYLGKDSYFVRYLIVDNIVTEIAVAKISMSFFDANERWVAKVCASSNQYDIYKRFFSDDLELLKIEVDIFLKEKGFKFAVIGI